MLAVDFDGSSSNIEDIETERLCKTDTSTKQQTYAFSKLRSARGSSNAFLSAQWAERCSVPEDAWRGSLVAPSSGRVWDQECCFVEVGSQFFGLRFQSLHRFSLGLSFPGSSQIGIPTCTQLQIQILVKCRLKSQ